MANDTQSEQLDKIVSALLGPPDRPVSRTEAARHADMTLAPVFEVIRDLKDLPRPNFKARLKSDLERRASMASSAKAAPESRVTATPYLSVRGASAAISFYQKALGATELFRIDQPDGRVGHAELNIGGAKIYLADEFPEIGFRSPETLGGSPVNIHLDVPDVDESARRMVAAGAAVVRPVADQFYGDRSGQFRDPFGYTWVLSTRKEEVSPDEMRRRAAAQSQEQSPEKPAVASEKAVNPIREGFHTVTPYLVIPDAARWLDFVKRAFGAEEHFRAKRPGAEDVIMHAEVKIGDSMLEVADANPEYPATPCTLLLRVSDPDAVYARAIEAGATVFDPVADHDYGSRGGTVSDASGNRWHIFTPTPGSDLFAAFRSVTPHLYAGEPVQLIDFLEKAFGAKELYRAEMPGGGIPHAQMLIGDSIVALAGGRGPYTPMPSTLHLYVPDTDALYERALAAGAASIQPPADQPYGDRSAGVTDPFGNRWFIATHTKDVAF
ncbi:MAG TPA: VOC family protein [Candidatus Acidoferrales bacterium]|jgi:PhnB protein|nr:VOC family protein [Candidatus Acidoferrales bacterium]